jgi:hypothetical protein
MRTILHVFKKDVRRLWKEIAVTLLLLADLAWMDRWRTDSTPGSTEGWLNLLLPLAWAFLIARVIHEDPLLGDRQFWVAMPVSGPSLITAKALFALAFIHAPDLAADAAILAARGFRPSAYLPALFWKQFLLIVALTLPGVALAALVRNVAQFMLAAIAAGAVAVFVSGGLTFGPPFPASPDNVRLGLALAPLALASFAVIALQFVRRWTRVSRTVAITAALASAMLYEWLPVESTAAVRCAVSPADAMSSDIRIQLAPEEALGMIYQSAIGSLVVVPIRISGIPTGLTTFFKHVNLEIESPEGKHYSTTRSSASQAMESREFFAGASVGPRGFALIRPRQDSLRLWINQKIYDAIKKGPVRIRGAMTAEFYRAGSPTRMRTKMSSEVPGVGRCTSIIAEAKLINGAPSLKVDCESLAPIPFIIQMRLLHPATGREWPRFFWDNPALASYPRMTWLSPLYHRDEFFHFTPPNIANPQGWWWTIPSDIIDTAELEISPERAAGCTVIRYDFPDVSLSRFAIKPGR